MMFGTPKIFETTAQAEPDEAPLGVSNQGFVKLSLSGLAKICGVTILPALLSGCFLTPGVFTSSMDIRRDGSFTFAYKGEMIFQSPNELVNGNKAPKVWNEKGAKCFKDKDSEPYYDSYTDEATAVEAAAMPSMDAVKSASDAADAMATAAEGPTAADGAETAPESNDRPCTKAELAKLRKTFDEEQAANAAKNNKESSEFAALFGFNPSDEAANQKMAATMMKYDGWKNVTYRGKGIFDVDYQISSKAGHDFLFPLIPQGDFIVPFVALRKREGGTVGVNAPALVGGGLKALAARGQALGRPNNNDLAGLGSQTKGTFTLTTDGEILTNNTEDGAAKDPAGRKLVWDIGPGTEKIPEALIRLK